MVHEGLTPNRLLYYYTEHINQKNVNDKTLHFLRILDVHRPESTINTSFDFRMKKIGVLKTVPIRIKSL